MAIIRSFPGWRPVPEHAREVACPPYDVLSSEEARRLAAGHARSFLHVTKPEIDLPETVDHYAPEVYAKAAENWKHFQQEGLFRKDEAPRLYLYRQVMVDHAQTGIVACSSVDDYFSGVIKKHEFTRPDKENDRLNHMYILQCQPEPVFLCYPDHEELDALVEKACGNTAVYDFTSDDGIRHVFWILEDPALIARITHIFKEEIPATYIADGHHRSAASALVGKRIAEENPEHRGDEEYNFFLSVLFPASQLMIMDYNRLVKDLHGLSAEDFLAQCATHFTVAKSESRAKPSAPHSFGLYLGGQWYSLEANPGTYNDEDPIAALDVTVLQEYLLGPVLGIRDQRTDKRIDFVGGIRGMEELEKRVDSGEMALAIALYPVSIRQLMDIAESGQVMPPKSTWFEPKLRSGLIVHAF